LTYESIISNLNKQNIFPDKLVNLKREIQELHVNCPATILMDSKVQRLKEVLKEYKVKISPMRNEGFVLIKLKK